MTKDDVAVSTSNNGSVIDIEAKGPNNLQSKENEITGSLIADVGHLAIIASSLKDNNKLDRCELINSSNIVDNKDDTVIIIDDDEADNNNNNNNMNQDHREKCTTINDYVEMKDSTVYNNHINRRVSEPILMNCSSVDGDYISAGSNNNRNVALTNGYHVDFGGNDRESAPQNSTINHDSRNSDDIFANDIRSNNINNKVSEYIPVDKSDRNDFIIDDRRICINNVGSGNYKELNKCTNMSSSINSIQCVEVEDDCIIISSDDEEEIQCIGQRIDSIEEKCVVRSDLFKFSGALCFMNRLVSSYLNNGQNNTDEEEIQCIGQRIDSIEEKRSDLFKFSGALRFNNRLVSSYLNNGQNNTSSANNNNNNVDLKIYTDYHQNAAGYSPIVEANTKRKCTEKRGKSNNFKCTMMSNNPSSTIPNIMSESHNNNNNNDNNSNNTMSVDNSAVHETTDCHQNVPCSSSTIVMANTKKKRKRKKGKSNNFNRMMTSNNPSSTIPNIMNESHNNNDNNSNNTTSVDNSAVHETTDYHQNVPCSSSTIVMANTTNKRKKKRGKFKNFKRMRMSNNPSLTCINNNNHNNGNNVNDVRQTFSNSFSSTNTCTCNIIIDGTDVALSSGEQTYNTERILKCVKFFLERTDGQVIVLVSCCKISEFVNCCPREVLKFMTENSMLKFVPNFEMGVSGVMLDLILKLDALYVTNRSFEHIYRHVYRPVLHYRLLTYQFVRNAFIPNYCPHGRNSMTFRQLMESH